MTYYHPVPMLLPLAAVLLLLSGNASMASGSKLECYEVETDKCLRGETHITGTFWCCYSYDD